MSHKYSSDFYRMTGDKYQASLRSFVKRLLHHNLRFMYRFRKYQQNRSIIGRFLLYRMTKKYGLEISVDAKIGEGLYLGHPYNITVAEGVVLGKNVNLHKGCTIGRENRGSRKGMPSIGNNVYVGINATIVGGITIGDDVVIAPNSFVNRDVPAHSVVVGNPATIHPKENATADYVNFCV